MTEQLKLMPILPSDYTRETMERVAKWACTGGSDSPDGNNCRNICDFIVEKLEDTLVFAWQVPQGEERIKIVAHSFLMFGENGKWVGDAQYLQYVPETEREGLPPVMFIPVINRKSFCQTLEVQYKVPEEFHHFWVDLVFDKHS